MTNRNVTSVHNMIIKKALTICPKPFKNSRRALSASSECVLKQKQNDKKREENRRTEQSKAYKDYKSRQREEQIIKYNSKQSRTKPTR